MKNNGITEYFEEVELYEEIWDVSYKLKCIFKLISISIIIFFTSACNTSLPLKETDDNSDQIAKTITDNIPADATLSLPTQEQSETITIITIDEMDEKTFIENLDIDTLNTVAQKIQELIDEIVKKQAENPESVIKGEWVTDFRNSEQYQYVLDFGVKAIKPMYYILYKSEQAGLYEYILSSAINDIIGYDFSNNNYQWANAYEFREQYNNCVKKSISQFYTILNDASMQQDEKAHSIADLGVFVIAPLLNELDYKYSVLDENTLCAIIKEIIKESYNSEIFEDLNLWRETNELYYHNIIEILPLP